MGDTGVRCLRFGIGSRLVSQKNHVWADLFWLFTYFSVLNEDVLQTYLGEMVYRKMIVWTEEDTYIIKI